MPSPALSKDTLFTNVALRTDGSPWWEGLSELAGGERLTDWKGGATKKGAGAAAHPNSRFTVALRQIPSVGSGYKELRGVPISAILFGGRRERLTPLVYEARNWSHGVYVGATLVSETTAAATGAVGVPRNDPMAMLPFCGFNMGDYFAHWLAMRKRLSSPPRIFHVNWFRTDDEGRLLWPGFGDNIRVLKWTFERLDVAAGARATPIGFVPTFAAMDLRGIDVGPNRFERLVAVDPVAWQQEAEHNGQFLQKFGDRLPRSLVQENEALLARLRTSLS